MLAPINLDSMSDFLQLLSHPPTLVEHLCRKFPRHASRIRALFAPVVSSASSPAPPAPPLEEPPPADVSHMDLIAAIIAVLKAHDGKLDKPDVEPEVFDRFKGPFSIPTTGGKFGGGVERWRKNVQFARNTACNALGLIKTPNEAGRGVWELTDKGHAWLPA